MIGVNGADASAWLAAIVENSFDAILSKSLDGTITSWNDGARNLFGYCAEEAIGQSVTLLIPKDRLHEEDSILAKLRAGERIAQFETIRRAKDGRDLHVELTISPVLDRDGRVIGASKIARDISQRHRQIERQKILLREMNHRIKNLLSIVQGLVSICRKSARSVDELAAELHGRLIALDAAHRLILPESAETGETKSATLRDILEAILAPYASSTIEMEVPGAPVGPQALTSLALIFHELATNSVKYGALGTDNGKLTLTAEPRAEGIDLRWREEGLRESQSGPEGFGTALQTAALRGLGAKLDRTWMIDGLEILLSFPFDGLER